MTKKFSYIDKRDKYRVLLTEVLPYEVPLWLSNEHYYILLKSHACPIIDKIKVAINPKKCIPYNYKTGRSNGKARTLSIMHPIIQLKIVDLYHKYHDIILYYCLRSDKSLRAPVDIASRYYEITSSPIESPERVEIQKKDQLEVSSYFVYNKYNFLFNFFESYEYHNLEKKFIKSLQVDVSKCFHHIYTHSISWAIKSKKAAKDNLNSKSFDSKFDRIMQESNYNETNGIIIGPEVSRIFAEIIFQSIDIELILRLKNKEIRIGENYEFRRYVDDFFFFFNEDSIKDKVLHELNNILEFYKLHLNESKSLMQHRPFMTKISKCKLALKKYLNLTFEPFKQGNFKINAPYSRLANLMIVEIKNTLSQFDVQYSSVSNYILSKFYKHIKGILSDDNINEKSKHSSFANLLVIYLDVIFFICAMDIRIRPTDRIAQTIQLILFRCKNFEEQHIFIIKKKIFDSIRGIVKNYIVRKEIKHNIEATNLILMLSMLGENFLLEEAFLKKVLNTNNKEDGYYFMWGSLMLYINNNNKYEELQNSIIAEAIEYMIKSPHGLNSSEVFMFFLDFLSCPFITQENKITLMKRIKPDDCFPCQKNKIASLIAKAQKKIYFIDWNDREWVRKRLKKKQYIFPYE